MGSSAKKKQEKKKDFQKVKLKVGKSKPKASNFTDTSFKAKSIALKKQTLSVAAPSTSSQIEHHTGLLKSRSDKQRHDALSFLTNLPIDILTEAAHDILPKVSSLIHDSSASVRQQLLKLLKRLPHETVIAAIDARPEELLLWIRVGMTNLAVDIRIFSLEVLEWILHVAGPGVVSSKGAWTGFLHSFVTVLGWKGSVESKGWSSFRQTGSRPGSETKSLARQLLALAEFLKVGLGTASAPAQRKQPAIDDFPYVDLKVHGIPFKPNAYAHLNLFGPVDDEHQMFEDRDDRQRVFDKLFGADIRRGLERVKKEGGELGRASAAVYKVLNDGPSS